MSVKQDILEYDQKNNSMAVKSQKGNKYDVDINILNKILYSVGCSSNEEYFERYNDLNGKTAIIDDRKWELVRIDEKAPIKKDFLPNDVANKISRTFNPRLIVKLVDVTEAPIKMGSGGEIGYKGSHKVPSGLRNSVLHNMPESHRKSIISKALELDIIEKTDQDLYKNTSRGKKLRNRIKKELDWDYK